MMLVQRLRVDILATTLVALVLAACSSQSPDTTPPEAITDLALLRVSETTATLTWTAPGNDGSEGQAASYDLRYSESALPGAWSTATPVVGLIPRAAGEPESVRVEGLINGTMYSLALKTLDLADNQSELSNVVQVNTGDTEGPATITDLRVMLTEPRAMTVEFTAPGDDGLEGQAQSYELRYATVPIDESNWATSTQFPTTTPQLGRSLEQIRITGLMPETQFFVALRALDDGGHVSEISNNADAELPKDTVPPNRITDLAVASTGPGWVTLHWTAPGDDGEEYQAAQYEARYASEPVTESVWEHATSLSGVEIPAEAGSPETRTFSGLPQGTLWFAIRAMDAAGNVSPVSTSAHGQSQPYRRTWEVRVDGSGDAPTVQAAIDSSSHGDAVVVYPGTYFENINLRGKAIHLRSAGGAEVTVLDGSTQELPVITCRSGETNTTIIEGLTIQNGRGEREGTGHYGAGIRCRATSPTIRYNIIRNNRAESAPGGSQSWGGGLIFSGNTEQLLLQQNTFHGNFAASNAGAIWAEGPCVIERNFFSGNSTGLGDGAALYIVGRPRGIYRYNCFVQNIAGDHGGGIYVNNAGINAVAAMDIDVHHNVIMHNLSLTREGPDCSGAGIWVFGEAWIHHNTIAFNTATNPSKRGFPLAGGICVANSGSGITIIENNLLYRNNEAGIVVFKFSGPLSTALVRQNLLYGNGPSQVVKRYPDGFDLILEENIFEDPMLCSPDGPRVAGASPALNQSFGQIGAVAEPGCSPYVSVSNTTWGPQEARHGP